MSRTGRGLDIVMVGAADNGGGAERVSWSLAEGLRERGHRVSFLCGTARHRGSRPLLGKLDWVLGRTVKRIGYADALSLAALRFLSYPEVRRADLLHFHNLHGFYFGVALLPRIFAAKPSVWTLHDCWPLSGGCYSHLGGEVSCEGWRHRCKPCRGHGVHPMTGVFDTAAGMLELKRKAFRALMGSHGLVTGVSDWMAGRARAFLHASGIDPVRVTALKNTVDLPAPSEARPSLPVILPPDRPVILLVAADVNNRCKGMTSALGALQLNLHTPFTLMTVGVPFPAEVLRRYGLEGRTVQLGHLEERALVAAAYRSAALTVVPSLAESFSLVAAESIACGTPVLASDVAALPELVRPGETGFLARVGDVPDFARHLADFLGMHSDERARLQRSVGAFAGRHFPSRSSWVTSYEELYSRVIAARVAPAPSEQYA